MDDSGQGPSAAKKQKIEDRGSLRKWSGAATYRSKFQKVWQQKWPFAVPVKGDPHCFHCTVCAKTVSCGHQGETDVACHAESIQHQRNTKAVKATWKLNFKPTTPSILTIKLANPEPCFKYEPTSAVLEAAKRATMEYNRAHSSQS